MEKLPSDKCGYDKSGNEPGPQRCEEPAQTTTSYCVFHTPIEEPKPDFWPRFGEYFDRTEREYKKAPEEMKRLINLDCRGFIFPDIPEDIFPEVVPFNVNFSGARFEGKADIKNVLFERNVRFRGTTFKGPSSFNKITMPGGDFSNATFEDTADFVSVQFEESAHFEDAEFHGNTLFKRVGFRERALYIGALFKNNIKFQEIYTTAIITIDTSRPEEAGKYKYPEVWFANVVVENPKRLTFKSVDLGNWVLAETEAISEAIFHSVTWEGGGKSKIKHTRDEAVANRVISWAIEDLSSYFRHDKAAAVYRRLRKNFESVLAYGPASDFFIGEMVTYRKDLFKKGKFGRWAFSWLYNIVSRYGECIWRPFLWFVGLWLFFAGIWFFKGFPYDGGSVNFDLTWPSSISPYLEMAKDVGRSLLYSFKTFLTLPDLKVGVASQTIGAIQRLAGASVITLFILALRRAFRR